MVSAKIMPFVPGHFTGYEWLALAIWAALGISISSRRNAPKSVLLQETQTPQL
jgi:hypothetical protein